MILDLTLPDGDGVKVYRALSAAHPDLPVVFSSGNAPPPELMAWAARGRIAFLSKPFELGDLLARLRDTLSK